MLVVLNSGVAEKAVVITILQVGDGEDEGVERSHEGIDGNPRLIGEGLKSLGIGASLDELQRGL